MSQSEFQWAETEEMIIKLDEHIEQKVIPLNHDRQVETSGISSTALRPFSDILI
jgi:hypothetical protein